jgi:hypothetical protein
MSHEMSHNGQGNHKWRGLARLACFGVFWRVWRDLARLAWFGVFGAVGLAGFGVFGTDWHGLAWFFGCATCQDGTLERQTQPAIQDAGNKKAAPA